MLNVLRRPPLVGPPTRVATRLDRPRFGGAFILGGWPGPVRGVRPRQERGRLPKAGRAPRWRTDGGRFQGTRRPSRPQFPELSVLLSGLPGVLRGSRVASVLVVEDEETIRVLAESILEGA